MGMGMGMVCYRRMGNSERSSVLSDHTVTSLQVGKGEVLDGKEQRECGRDQPNVFLDLARVPAEID